MSDSNVVNASTAATQHRVGIVLVKKSNLSGARESDSNVVNASTAATQHRVGIVLVKKSNLSGARESDSNVVNASTAATQHSLSMGAVVQIVRIKSTDLNGKFGSYTYSLYNSLINQILNYVRKENVKVSSGPSHLKALYAANTKPPLIETANGSNSELITNSRKLMAIVDSGEEALDGMKTAASSISASEFNTRKHMEKVTSSSAHLAVDSKKQALYAVRTSSSPSLSPSPVFTSDFIIKTRKQMEKVTSSSAHLAVDSKKQALYAVRTSSSPSLSPSPVFTSDFITKPRKQIKETSLDPLPLPSNIRRTARSLQASPILTSHFSAVKSPPKPPMQTPPPTRLF